jgi:Fe-S oxidoreductase
MRQVAFGVVLLIALGIFAGNVVRFVADLWRGRAVGRPFGHHAARLGDVLACFFGQIARTWVQLLRRARVDFAVLGPEESGNGDRARRSGNEFAGSDVRKILVLCPCCYHTIKNEPPQLGRRYEVWHHSQFLARLVAEGRLRPDRDVSAALACHDACYLGRWNGISEAPRQVLASACGGRPPRELPRHGPQSFCCGAGGGHLFLEDAPPRINVHPLPARRREEPP